MKALSYITEITWLETKLQDEKIEFRIQLKLNVDHSFMAIQIDLPPDYPNQLPSFAIGESFMVKATTLSFLQQLVKKIQLSRNTFNFNLMKVLECAYYIVDGNLKHSSVQWMQTLVGDDILDSPILKSE